MNGEYLLYRDQWGNCWGASSIKQLRASIGGGRVAKMYRDTKDGGAVHVGYIVGRHWCEAFRPVRNPA